MKTQKIQLPRSDYQKGLKCHVNKITSKANKTLGFLRRNIKIDSTEVKTRAFNT